MNLTIRPQHLFPVLALLLSWSMACSPGEASTKPSTPVTPAPTTGTGLTNGDTGTTTTGGTPGTTLDPDDSNGPAVDPQPTTPTGTPSTTNPTTTPTTGTGTTPTKPTESVYLLCEILKSDDRSDFPAAMTEVKWNAYLHGLAQSPKRGFLCYQAEGSSLEALRAECLAVGEKIRALKTRNPVKAFPIEAKASTDCDEEVFQPEDNSCSCNSNVAKKSYSVMGWAEYGLDSDNVCKAAFDFCETPLL